MAAINTLRKLMLGCGGITILLGLVILFAPGHREMVEDMVGVMLLSSAAVWWLLR